MKPDYGRAIRAVEAEYDLGRAIARKSAVSKGDLKKYEKLSGKDILPTETHQEISKQLFQYTPLSAKFDEQKKAIETQGDKMVKAIESATKPGSPGNQGNQLVPLEDQNPQCDLRRVQILEDIDKTIFKHLYRI